MSRRAPRGKLPAPATEFDLAPGWRPAGGALCALISAMLMIHQLYVEGPKPVARLAALLGSLAFAAIAVWLIRRGLRRGAAVRVGPERVGMALGFDGWLEVPWDQVRAWRYWEPTGFALLVKRRQPRWVGLRLHDDGLLARRRWDERLEMALARLYGRPSLCILHPFVAAPILEVLEAFQTHAPDLADREGRIV